MASGKQVRLEVGLHARLQELARANHRELSAELGLAVGRWLEVREGSAEAPRLAMAERPKGLGDVTASVYRWAADDALAQTGPGTTRDEYLGQPRPEWPADKPCLCGRQMGIARCEECPDPGFTIPNAVGVSGRCAVCGAELEWSVADRWWRCPVHGSDWQGAPETVSEALWPTCDHCGAKLEPGTGRCPVHGMNVVMF